MNVIRSQVIFVFERNLEMRKRVFDFEEKLSDFFQAPFHLINIPDQVDPMIPRFEAESYSGFSSLQVTQVRGVFSTIFSEDWSSEYKKIKKYLNEKINVLKSLFETETINYCGFIIECHYSLNNVNQKIMEHSGIKALDEKTRDFSLYYSMPYKEDYFINIKIDKTSVEFPEFDKEKEKIKKNGSKSSGLNVLIDMNYKNAFLNGKTLPINAIDYLEEILFRIIENNKIENFLEGKIYYE